MPDDMRVIEDFIPIRQISAEASREKSLRKGHISTLHPWWARRPLVACRAAVYGALVPLQRWLVDVNLKNPPADPAKAEAMKNGAALGIARGHISQFMKELCRYPGDENVIAKARRHILEAHRDRLAAEGATDRKGRPVTKDTPLDDVPPPKVLDMFAGGGAIPLEALRLGCEAYALDLNPVAYIVLLCTLVYPQKYGRPDPTRPGMTGPPGPDGKPTWGGLAKEVEYWGRWVLKEVRRQIGDLYPPIPDPRFRGKRPEIEFDRSTGCWVPRGQAGKPDESPDDLAAVAGIEDKPSPPPPGYLQPVAYLWTRTVPCKNPACGKVVPLVRQTWLCKKKGRYIALRMIAPADSDRVRFEVVEASSPSGLGFDPAAFSRGGNATCPFCGTVADSDYVKQMGRQGRMDRQLMAVVCTKPGTKGKIYVSADDLPAWAVPDDDEIHRRIDDLCRETGLTVPDEPIITDAKNSCWTHLYGLARFCDLFTPRQMLCLLTFAAFDVRCGRTKSKRSEPNKWIPLIPINSVAQLDGVHIVLQR